MDNHTYDIIKALTKKADAAWVYDQYLKDSQGCEECRNLWEKLKKEDEKDIRELEKTLKDHKIAKIKET